MTGHETNNEKETKMTTTKKNTKADTSIKNLKRLCKVAAEMRAAGNEDGCQAVLAAIHQALGAA
jgi:hypothetical protein